MKSLLLLFFCVFNLGNIEAQIVDIPDPNFKAKLLQSAPWNDIALDSNDNSVAIDINNNGEIEVSEALSIFKLDVQYENITDLTGIQAFVNLEYLQCRDNYLSVIDISQNPNLTYLNVSRNQLTDIDVSQNNNLITLDLYFNELSNLDVTQNINLEYLNCERNDLTTLNVLHNINLKTLRFGSNEIGYMDISQNLNLEYLNGWFNNLTTIDVSQNLDLKTLIINSNYNLTTLDVTHNVNLEVLWVGINDLTTLDVSQNTNLESLSVSGNDNLIALDITQNINLNQLSIVGNDFTALDISQNINLVSLDCRNNDLTTLDLSQNPNLEYLDCRNNNLINLDLSQNPNLESLSCSNNQLTELDLSNNGELIWWRCDNNQITNINIKNGGFSFDESAISFNELNVENNPIEFICADEEEILALQELTNYQGPISSYCSFSPGGEYNTISGDIIFDADNNSCDTSDYNFPNLRVLIDDGTTSGSAFSNQSGDYTFYTDIGNHELIPEFENPDFFNVDPLNTIIDFTDLNNTINQDFCVTANGIHNDLEIVIVPTIPAQPGFDAYYQLVYKNKGNQVLSGSIDFSYDDGVLDYVSTSEVPSIQNSGNLSWEYVDLNPFESRVIEVVLNANSPMETPAVNIDDILNFTAAINPVSGDENSEDNTFTLEQVVVGSYDPNDIICLEGNIVSPDKIGEYLHYNIRFENTGTAPATFVVVRDDIDETQYDLNTLQILNSSHNMYTRITENRVEFIFDNINLAPTETGNVVFKIKTLDTLTVGDDVEQQAEIYFDYNFPIITNIAQTNFQALSIDDVSLNSTINIFPNPISDVVEVKSKSVIELLRIYDIHGRLTFQKVFDKNEASIKVSQYESGVYFIEITSSSGRITKRVIKK
ncbi:T9SS type A sorting domain-containing protein [Winogradskyella sp. MIT101101]|uniref:DUF7619 domain-containing protein n=1 Tax=Winogradskyella sp. MIT101101 TaxID=3098297 RepID=UPI00399BCD96